MRVRGDRVGQGEVRTVVRKGRVEGCERGKRGIDVEVGAELCAQSADCGRVRGDGTDEDG